MRSRQARARRWHGRLAAAAAAAAAAALLALRRCLLLLATAATATAAITTFCVLVLRIVGRRCAGLGRRFCRRGSGGLARLARPRDELVRRLAAADCAGEEGG